jgi:thioredoxin-related protein
MFLVAILLMSSGWLTSFEKAKEQAHKENKPILVYFSGEDWCYTCKQTRKQILERDAFINYADNNLILVNADFPRLNKKSISESQAKENKALADVYNPDMAIPAFVLVDADGKVLKKWQGNTGISADEFVGQIEAAGH